MTGRVTGARQRLSDLSMFRPELVRLRRHWAAQSGEIAQCARDARAMECVNRPSSWFGVFVAAHERVVRVVEQRCTGGEAVLARIAAALNDVAEVLAEQDRETRRELERMLAPARPAPAQPGTRRGRP